MLLERALSPLLVTFFLVAAGSLAARMLGVFEPGLWTTRALRTDVLGDRLVLGAALATAVAFLAALTGLYQPVGLAASAVVLTLLGISALAGERELARSRGPAEGPPEDVAPSDRTVTPVWQRVLLAALGALLGILWLQSIRPDIAWDSNVYHLSVPARYLREGGFLPIELNVYSNWPLALELLFGWAMAIHDHVLAKQLHFVFGALVLVLFHQRALRTPAPAAATLVAAGLLLANPVAQFEMRLAYVDLGLSFFVVAAAAAAERALALDPSGRGAERRVALTVLGVACGMVCGLKLSGFLAAAAVLVVASWSIARRWGARTLVSDAAPVLLPLFALALPWVLKSWWFTGNPVYPLFWDVFGGPDWSAELARQHSEWQRSIGMGRGALDYLLLPWRVIVEGGQGYARFDGRLHLAWLPVVPWIVWRATRDGETRRFLAMAALTFATWAVTSQQIRLLLPTVALLSWAGGRAIVTTAPRARWLAPGVAAALLVLAGFQARDAARQAPRLAVDLARLGYDALDAVVHPVYRFVDTLPESARLLLLNTNHGYFVQRPYLADSFFEASQIRALFGDVRDGEEALRLLQRRDVTHVLFEVREAGMPYPPALLRMLSDPALARPVYRSPDGRYVVLELPAEGVRFPSPAPDGARRGAGDDPD